MTERPWVIIGAGQLGCSLAKALKQSGQSPALIGVEHQPEHREKAAFLNIFQQVTPNLDEALREASLIVLATPLLSLPSLLEPLTRASREDAVVTDVGSVKSWVAEQFRLQAPGVQFVPGHPIAGTEKSGPTAADADLFRGKTHWLCPLPENRAEALLQVEKLWRLAGAEVQNIPCRQHDEIYARTSHAAQLLSWVLAEVLAEHTLLPCPHQPTVYRTLRIGGSDATMWRDIFLTNRQALLPALHDLARTLERLARRDETGMLQALHWRKHARRIPTPVRPEWLNADRYSSYGNLLAPAVTLAAAYVMTVLQWQQTLETSLIPYLGAGFLGLTRPAAAETLWYQAIAPHEAERLLRHLQDWIALVGNQEAEPLQERILKARQAHTGNLQQLQLHA